MTDDKIKPIVTTIKELCKRCYSCVRECPAKAIRVENGQAMVIEERCIACGNCVKVCAQKAKHIEESIQDIESMFERQEKVYACLAPSFPAAFTMAKPGQIIAAIRKLGFGEVWEVAYGAELISKEYIKNYQEAQKTGKPIITTPCPAIVSYVEKYIPTLHDNLAPIVSPMIAVARAIRIKSRNKLAKTSARIVFIGPCISKKKEIHDPCLESVVDAVLTYEELVKMFYRAGIVPGELSESSFDGPRCYLGRTYPITGGLLKAAGLSTDVLDNHTVVAEGKERVIEVLNEIAQGRSKAQFFDLLFCEGCINGPMMLNDLGVVARKEQLVNYINEQNRFTTQRAVIESIDEFDYLDLGRSFSKQNLVLYEPSEEEIKKVLKTMRKESMDQQLNCGACGYRTCKEKAIAVCQGLAEPEMCLPYLIDELQSTCQRLEISHHDLAEAQQRLLQTEKLASMGQLSAGVAHEINNPLGTILLYSHILIKELKESDQKRKDLELIVKEANRCKEIVRGLLDFARQSRVSKAENDIGSIINEIYLLTSNNMKEVNVVKRVEKDLPKICLDKNQIMQALINLVNNSIDAVPKGGEVKLYARLNDRKDSIEIQISDNGTGIAKENLSKLFTPFFTTKEMGKGTGLGLAITYGIIKMHSGTIIVDSELGKGTTFTITLPLVRAEKQVLQN